MRVVTGHQPTYLPWLGLFHKIALADVFVFMDDVQYLEGDWNNRNFVKGPHGPLRLTVPVRRGSGRLALHDVSIAGERWAREHWDALRSAYGRAAFWARARPVPRGRVPRPALVVAVGAVRPTCCAYLLAALDIDVEWVTASAMGFTGRKSALILEHVERLDGDAVILGRHGRDYLDERPFRARGILVRYQDYRHPEYPQRFGAFRSHLSVLDLLLNCGPASRSILLSGNVDRAGLGLGEAASRHRGIEAGSPAH